MPESYTKEESDVQHTKLLEAMTTSMEAMHEALDSNLNNKLSELPSQEDTDEIKKLLKNINFGVSIFKVSGRTLSYVGAIFGGLAAILLVLKFGIVAIIHWALGN